MFQVRKRDGKLVEFDMSKISTAISKAFNACQLDYTADILNTLSLKVTADFSKKIKDGVINVEDVQDSVEVVLIQNLYMHHSLLGAWRQVCVNFVKKHTIFWFWKALSMVIPKVLPKK